MVILPPFTVLFFLGFFPIALGAAPVDLGPLNATGRSYDCRADQVTVVDEQNIVIPSMYYNGQGPYAWFVIGHDLNEGMLELPNGYRLRPLTVVHHDPSNPCVAKPPAYNGNRVDMKLPQGDSVTRYRFLSLVDLKDNITFCWVEIPDVILADPPSNPSTLKVCTRNEVKYLDGDKEGLIAGCCAVCPTVAVLMLLSVLFVVNGLSDPVSGKKDSNRRNFYAARVNYPETDSIMCRDFNNENETPLYSLFEIFVPIYTLISVN